MDRAHLYLGPVTTVALPLVTLCICVTGSAAQESSVATAVGSEITAERLLEHAREITRYVRPSGSAGENAAIDYVVEQLRDGGVPVEVHEFMAYTSNPVSATVTVPGTDLSPLAITMSFSGSTTGVEASIVDLGTLGDLPVLELGTGENLRVREDPALAHVQGKIALVTGQPRNISTAVLQHLGAVAAIYVNPEERLNELIVTSTWGTPSLLSAHRLNELPTVQVQRSAGARLRAMMADGDVVVRITAQVDTGWKPLRLAVARVMPDDNADAPYVLFGGHIDGWHYGATDEAASNAAMVELALGFHRNRARLRRGLVVAWWPGHSNARYGGSTWFADHYFDELFARGLAYVNVDGIGQTGAKRFGAATSPALSHLAARVIDSGTGQDIRPSRPGRNSDQAFNGAGLPLLQLNHTRLSEDGGYWWWHTPDDTFDKIDGAVLERDSRLYADALGSLLADPIYPVDLAAEACALVAALTAREDESGGALDLSEARRRAGELTTTLKSMGSLVANAAPGPALDLELLAIVRPIHRVMFVPTNNHHPDPGVSGRPLPGLDPAGILAEEPADSDRYRFAQAQLIRETNRVLEAIAEASYRAEDLRRMVRRPGT